MAKTPKPRPDPISNPRSRASRHSSHHLSTTTNPFKPLNSTLAPASKPRATLPPHKTLHTVAGVTKNKNKKKRQTRQQRQRQERGLARAADVLDKLERKMEGSVRREKVGRERRKGWEEVNHHDDLNQIQNQRVGARGKEERNGEAEVEEMEEEWEDDEGEVNHGHAGEIESKPGEQGQVGELEVEERWEDKGDMNRVMVEGNAESVVQGAVDEAGSAGQGQEEEEGHQEEDEIT